MKTKEKKSKGLKPIPPISEWGPEKYGVKLYINPDWGINFYDGMSLDVEDDEAGNCIGIGMYSPELNCCYYWNDKESLRQLTFVYRTTKFIAHNGRTDIAKLQKWGFDVSEANLMWDTQIFAHLIDSSRPNYGLKALAKEELNIEYPSYEDLTGKKTSKNHITLDKLPLEVTANYNAMDCLATYRLYEKQQKGLHSTQIQPLSHYYFEIEKPLAFVLQRMEQRGVRIDLPYVKNELKPYLEKQKEPLEKAIKNELGDINLNSWQQKLEALAKKKIFPIKPFGKNKGKPSTDESALEKFQHIPVVANLLAYSKIQKLTSTYVDPYIESGIETVHPYFNQCGTRTGRFSCSGPNLQNIPVHTEDGKRVRRMYIPREGYLFGEADYGQGEPHMLAVLSKNPKMIEMFNRGIDFHTFFANGMNIPREVAKVFDLETYYGATEYGVARTLNCTEFEAQKAIEKAWNLFPGLEDWRNQLIYETKKRGYFTTLFGRRIKVDNLDEYNKWKREAAQRQLMNNICQASLGEVVKKAMIAVDKAGIDILVQVHDSLLLEMPKEYAEEQMSEAMNLMNNCVKLDVPLVTDGHIADNWSDCKGS